MKILLWVTSLAFVLLTFFAIANWSLLTAPASLNFLAFTVEGPLGLILFAATLVFIGLFAVYALSLRTSALIEGRRHVRELGVQRELADKAEASRYTALATRINEEFVQTRTATDHAREELLRRVESAEQAMLNALNETANSISASVGEVDDKLDRLTSGGGTTP